MARLSTISILALATADIKRLGLSRGKGAKSRDERKYANGREACHSASRSRNGKRYRDSSASVFEELRLNRENRRHCKAVGIGLRNGIHDECAIKRCRRTGKSAEV